MIIHNTNQLKDFNKKLSYEMILSKAILVLMIIKSRLKKNWVELIAVFLTFIFICAGSILSTQRHAQFDSFWYDFGIFDETLWKFSTFQSPIIPGKNHIHIWGDHFNPSILTIAPLYWITSNQDIVLISQAVFVGLAGLIIFFSIKQITSKLLSLSLLISFFGYIGTQNALYTDAHNMVYATLPLSLIICSVIKEKKLTFMFSCLWFLGWQENAAGILVGIGIWIYYFKSSWRKIAVLTSLSGLAWAIIASQLLIPHFAGYYPYKPEIPKTLHDLIISPIYPWLKLKTIFYSLLSFSFLPVFYPPLWPALIEQVLERFVLNTAATRWELGMHYNAILAPLFIASSALSAEKLRHKFPRLNLNYIAIGNIVLVICLHQIILHGPFGLVVRREFYEQTSNNQHYQSFLSKIPRDKGLIMTNNNLAAHLTHYNIVLLYKYLYFDKIQPKVVAIYTREGQNPNNYYPLSREDALMLIDQLKTDSTFNEIYNESDGSIFLKVE